MRTDQIKSKRKMSRNSNVSMNEEDDDQGMNEQFMEIDESNNFTEGNV